MITKKANEVLISSLWGFSEATFFFLIPDIYLTRVAIQQPFRAQVLCLYTALAACFGGALMYLFASTDSHEAIHFLTLVPAIYPKLIHQVASSLDLHGLSTMLTAPLRGIPYKIVAVEVGAKQINFGAFIVLSFAARLLRFWMTTGITIVLAKGLRKCGVHKLRLIHTLAWVVIYTLYFVEIYKLYS